MSKGPTPSSRPTTNTPLQRAIAIFAGQHGAAADRQIRATGLTWEQQCHLLAKGIWQRYATGVLIDAGSSPTWGREAMSATLLPGSRPALAAGAAGRVHQLDGCLAVAGVTVIIPRGGHIRPPQRVTVLHSRLLKPEDIVKIGQLRVTTIAVTLIQLQAHGPNAEQALDDALRKGQSPAGLKKVFDRWHKFGVTGPAGMLALLSDRVEARLPLSWFQRLAERLLADRGITLEPEWPLLDSRGKLLAAFDLADVEHQVGIECQSWEHHGSPAARRADTDRKRRVREYGWEIVELWWSDKDRMDAVVADYLRVRDRAAIVRAHSLSA